MREYKVGDELRIREWDDMANEFGLNGSGNIKILPAFTKSMEYLCGEKFTVSRIVGSCYFSFEEIEYTRNDGNNYWAITEKMLEPREEKPLYIASDTEINKLLFE